MAKSTNKRPPDDAIAMYDRLLASIPELERKGDTMPYTSINGNMFTLLTREGTLGIRLPKEDLHEFMEAHALGQLTRYGRVMKEYAEVPGGLLANTEVLGPWLQRSLEYAKALKPK